MSVRAPADCVVVRGVRSYIRGVAQSLQQLVDRERDPDVRRPVGARFARNCSRDHEGARLRCLRVFEVIYINRLVTLIKP